MLIGDAILLGLLIVLLIIVPAIIWFGDSEEKRLIESNQAKRYAMYKAVYGKEWADSMTTKHKKTKRYQSKVDAEFIALIKGEK